MASPRILNDLGRELSRLLEAGLSPPGEPPVPVFLCHPLDPIDEQRTSPSGVFGVLCLASVDPDLRYRQNTPTLEHDPTAEGLGERLRRPPLWVRTRYVFLVAGGTSDLQLIALGSALQTLHDTPELELEVGGEAAVPELDAAGGAAPGREALAAGATDGAGASRLRLPLKLVESPSGWRELGLTEHRLSISFEVSCPIPSARSRTLRRTEERALDVGLGPR